MKWFRRALLIVGVSASLAFVAVIVAATFLPLPVRYVAHNISQHATRNTIDHQADGDCLGFEGVSSRCRDSRRCAPLEQRCDPLTHRWTACMSTVHSSPAH